VLQKALSGRRAQHEIATEFGVGKSTIQNWLRHYGVIMRRNFSENRPQTSGRSDVHFLESCTGMVFLLMMMFLLVVSRPDASLAQGPGYSESVALAEEHAATPDGWQGQSLFVIPDGPESGQGLVFDNGKLVVRTATRSVYYNGNHVGQPGYRIYGLPTKDAAWVTTGNDLTRFLLENHVGGDNVITLTERGLGMDATGTHDAVVEYTVDPQYLMRPTRNPDISRVIPGQYGMHAPFVQPDGMRDEVFSNFKAYYDNWLVTAYSQYPFPWTQLGYTFFWGNGNEPADIQGMSEFIILGGTPVDIYGIYATGSYLYTRNDGDGFSDAPDASFGNGFAGFNIDGACDTVWAGHRFQSRVSADITDGNRNEISIGPGGSVSGGQGILVWSLNYDVTNEGIISGATSGKFGLPGTENTAILFKGDTGTDHGTPVTAGINRVDNKRVISSPGTAIRADSGDTVIVNHGTGTVSGGLYAVQTGGGNDTVTVHGGTMTGKIYLGTGDDRLVVTGRDNPARLNFALDSDYPDAPQVLVRDGGLGGVTIADNTELAVTVNGKKHVGSGHQFLIVDTASLDLDSSSLAVFNDTGLPMISFSSVREGEKLYLQALRDTGYYRENSGNASLGSLIDQLAVTAQGDMSVVLGQLDRSGIADNVRLLEPDVSGGVVQTADETMTRFNRNIMGRLYQALVNRGPGAASDSGHSIAAGPVRPGWWAQGFGSVLHQDEQGSAPGFQADVRGVSLGYDRQVKDMAVAGAGFGFARGRIITDGSVMDTDSDTFQGDLYAGVTQNDFYLGGILSLAYHRYDAGRQIRFGTLERTALSHYSGLQYSGYLEGGRTFSGNGFFLTPLASLHYAALRLGEYDEDGAGSLSLNVDSRNSHLLQTGLGARLAFPMTQESFTVIPELQAVWLYDFAAESQTITAGFREGGGSFAARGPDEPESGFIAGASLTLASRSNGAVLMGYDVEWKKKFAGHSGHIRMSFAF
jgi:outer membrane autotransporter protein